MLSLAESELSAEALAPSEVEAWGGFPVGGAEAMEPAVMVVGLQNSLPRQTRSAWAVPLGLPTMQPKSVLLEASRTWTASTGGVESEGGWHDAQKKTPRYSLRHAPIEAQQSAENRGRADEQKQSKTTADDGTRSRRQTADEVDGKLRRS